MSLNVAAPPFTPASALQVRAKVLMQPAKAQVPPAAPRDTHADGDTEPARVKGEEAAKAEDDLASAKDESAEAEDKFAGQPSLTDQCVTLSNWETHGVRPELIIQQEVIPCFKRKTPCSLWVLL